MTKPMKREEAGFTLIELMIVVVIIGILAAVAIPQFLKYQMKSKTTEATRNLGAIKISTEAFRGKWALFPVALMTPDTVPGVSKASFIPASPSTGFALMGFSTAGNVYYSYAVDAAGNVPVETEFNGSSCGLTGPATETAIVVDSSVAGVDPAISMTGDADVIFMIAKGDLDGNNVMSCFVMGNDNTDLIGLPAVSGESIF